MKPARSSATPALQAVLATVLNVSGSVRHISSEFSRFKTQDAGVSGRHATLFVPLVDQGLQHLRWVDAELVAVTRISHAAAAMDDPDMQRALLRLAGPRLEAAMLSSVLLAVWRDFINLADVVLEQCPYYSVERLFRQLHSLQEMMKPSLAALASSQASSVEAAAADIPALVGHLTGEFAATREAVRVSAAQVEQMLRVKELIEMLTTASAMKMALPRLTPGATAPLGPGLVVSTHGVMMGSQLVVSAEWMEMMRQLIQAGVISLPVVSASVRIHAGQVLLSQSNQELPRSVRDALGAGPEVRSMRVTDRVGAGMSEPPEHHVLPREFREWFEKRGFTGELSIDRFCVRLERSHHEAIHGGGDWRLGRTWAGEWNRLIMSELRDAETAAGRLLTRDEILKLVAKDMRDYRIPMNFISWSGK